MGVVISDRPPIRSQRSFIVMLLLLVLGLGTLVIYSLSTYRSPTADWSIAQLARAVQKGEVDRLSFAGDRAVVETQTGIRALVSSPDGGTVIGSLYAYGVPEESLSAIEVVHQAPPRIGPIDFLQRLLQWFWVAPIVILVGVGGFALRHVHKSRQTI